MSIEQQFIQAINANAGQGDRLAEYVYADWLDERGDPRAEGWRVLLEQGKRPDLTKEGIWQWWYYDEHCETTSSRTRDILGEYPNFYLDHMEKQSKTFYGAMNNLTIAWLRYRNTPVS